MWQCRYWLYCDSFRLNLLVFKLFSCCHRLLVQFFPFFVALFVTILSFILDACIASDRNLFSDDLQEKKKKKLCKLIQCLKIAQLCLKQHVLPFLLGFDEIGNNKLKVSY